MVHNGLIDRLSLREAAGQRGNHDPVAARSVGLEDDAEKYVDCETMLRWWTAVEPITQIDRHGLGHQARIESSTERRCTAKDSRPQMFLLVGKAATQSSRDDRGAMSASRTPSPWRRRADEPACMHRPVRPLSSAEGLNSSPIHIRVRIESGDQPRKRNRSRPIDIRRRRGAGRLSDKDRPGTPKSLSPRKASN